MLLIHPVREAIRYIPVLIGVFFAGNSNGNGHWWSVGVLAVVIVLAGVRWATTRFQITADQVQLRTGLVRKRTLVTPIDRVRTIDVTEHALHRVLGLAKVAIGTGTADHKKEGLVLDGLGAREARALRAELLHRSPPVGSSPAGHRSGYHRYDLTAARTVEPTSPPADDLTSAATFDPTAKARPEPWAGAEQDEQELLRLDPSWVRYAPFTLSGLLTAAAILGFAWNVLNQSSVKPGSLGAVRSTGRHLRDSPWWAISLQAGIAVIVVISLLSIVGYLLAFWNFRLTRHPEGTLHTSRGLITARSTSIEARRLRGVELTEPFLLRLVRAARLSAIATGLRTGRGSDRTAAVLAPPSPRRIAERTGAWVLDDPGAPAAMTGTLSPHPAAARRRRLVRSTVPAAVVSAGVIALGVVLGQSAIGIAAAVVILVSAAWLGTDRYRALGHAVFGPFLVSRSGSVVRRRVALERDGIIGWNLHRTFFQRRVGLASLAATTAAGRQAYLITDISLDESVTVITAATPGLLEQFLLT
ncbi:PH domain-containing protein [Jatrophihabitans telluris]|uniref:PH domain-containing protein n=1 Tax=Jatrophihabitans telluris TaxID=2038343 RepID=A0ABY4QXX6_9ACTN|nr:PH domain-containing protein [Jatrophihabitans telluris]UQX88355.1 PH domain-containing protein [Jatrophihabitans telluris]